MKARLFCFWLSALLSLTAGCNLFTPYRNVEKTPMHIYLNQSRFNMITASGKFVCLIDQERPPAQDVIRDIIKIAEQSALTVEFRTIPYSLRVPALLRSGKGDVAIGNYTAQDAAEKHLDHLKIRNTICLLRKDDADWKKILAAGIAILAEPAEKMTAPPVK